MSMNIRFYGLVFWLSLLLHGHPGRLIASFWVGPCVMIVTSFQKCVKPAGFLRYPTYYSIDKKHSQKLLDVHLHLSNLYNHNPNESSAFTDKCPARMHHVQGVVVKQEESDWLVVHLV